jgi:hydroxymethylpyrimidine pyrophosphatase-like HAD family hydrolase
MFRPMGLLSRSRVAPPSGGFRMLAFDLDGTFLERDGRLSGATARFLSSLRSDGIELLAATGRRLYSALPVLDELALGGSVVVHNGAMVANVPNGAPERIWPLDAGVVRAVAADLRRRGLSVLLFTASARGPGEVLAEEGGVDPSGYLAWYFHYASGHFSLYPDLGAAPLDGVLRVAAHGEKALLDEAARELPLRFAGRLRAFVQRETVMEAHRIEVMAAGVNKWAGVSWVAARHGIAAEQIVAVGDEANDAEMLAGAGWSLAAPGASAAARALARESVKGDGPAALVRAVGRVLHR